MGRTGSQGETVAIRVDGRTARRDRNSDAVLDAVHELFVERQLVPTVEAWHLPSEPWLFGISGDGTVQSRIDGAFGGTEMKALLDSLVAPR